MKLSFKKLSKGPQSSQGKQKLKTNVDNRYNQKTYRVERIDFA